MSPLCHLSKTIRGTCDKCGNVAEVLHMPEEIHGWYCERCCPVCSCQEEDRRAA